MSQAYRWNVVDHAAGFDAAAEHIHPHYLEMQDVILDQIVRPAEAEFLLVDLGGGSGRLAEKFLSRFSRARALVIDQSEPFLEIARKRLDRFGGRGSCRSARLQDDWSAVLPCRPSVIVSMSAIHHLDADEKQRLYKRCYDVLEAGGTFMNGDEVRAMLDRDYLADMKAWVKHKERIVAEGLVDEAMVAVLAQWEDRNVTHFGQPRVSGDDCHETVQAQLGYLTACGFRDVDVPWEKEMWAIMRGTR